MNEINNDRIETDFMSQFTQEEIAEYIKCSQDAVYFVEKYISFKKKLII